MYSFIELLRALAALLITNSHFDGVYPWEISWGGCPGVSLFFAISGFLLVKSVQRESFLPWWAKKVIRLYIPLTLVNVVTVLLGFRKASISLFLFPITINLWYVPAVSFLYILYYFVLHKLGGMQEAKVKAVAFVAVIYVIVYFFSFKDVFFVEKEIIFRLLYCFSAMMLGSIIYEKKNHENIKSMRCLWLLLGVASCGGFLIMKLLMNRVLLFIKLQFMTQIFSVTFACFMMLAGLGYEQKIQELMKTWIGRILAMISRCSLEIYLVQFAIIGVFKGVVFPLNFVLIVGVIIISAEVIHRLSVVVERKAVLFLLKSINS